MHYEVSACDFFVDRKGAETKNTAGKNCVSFPLTPLLHTTNSHALAWLCARMVEDRCVEVHAAAYDDLEDVDWFW